MSRLCYPLLALCLLFAACTTNEPAEPPPTEPPRFSLPAAEVQTLPDSLKRPQRPLPLPRPAPDLSLTTLTGESLRLDENKMVLLNFWATWCGPCIAEMPDLEALYQELKNDGFTIIGVALDEEGAAVVEPFIQEIGVTYPIVIDDGTIVDAFGGVSGLPTTFLIDPNAQILNRFIGLFPAEEMRLPIRDMMGLPLE